MSSNMESALQSFDEGEYFDFDAASGGLTEAEASYTAQGFETGGFPWNETLDDSTAMNNDYPQCETPANDKFYPSDNFALNNFVWAEMNPTLQPASNTAITYDHSNRSWGYDSGISQSNSLELDGMELSAPNGSHNHLDFPLAQTDLGIEAYSVVGGVPLGDRQSE
jgi:hypothetical protein